MIWINSLPPVLTSECLCSSSCWTLFCDELPHCRTRLSYPIEIMAKNTKSSDKPDHHPSHLLWLLSPHTGTLDFPSECHQHQTHAPDLRPRGGGHDPSGRPQRSWHPPQPAHPLQWMRHLCECPPALVHTEHTNVYGHLQSNIKSFLLTSRRGSNPK